MIINTVEINGKEYDEIDIITLNNIKYAFLIDSNNNKDLLIQRITTENDTEYYEPLNSKEEYDNALIEFYQKHKDLDQKR